MLPNFAQKLIQYTHSETVCQDIVSFPQFKGVFVYQGEDLIARTASSSKISRVCDEKQPARAGFWGVATG